MPALPIAFFQYWLLPPIRCLFAAMGEEGEASSSSGPPVKRTRQSPASAFDLSWWNRRDRGVGSRESYNAMRQKIAATQRDEKAELARAVLCAPDLHRYELEVGMKLMEGAILLWPVPCAACLCAVWLAWSAHTGVVAPSHSFRRRASPTARHSSMLAPASPARRAPKRCSWQTSCCHPPPTSAGR